MSGELKIAGKIVFELVFFFLKDNLILTLLS